jgi:hypothetical protein
MARREAMTREANAGMKWQDKFHPMGKMTNFHSATKWLPDWPPEPAKLSQTIPPHKREILREALRAKGDPEDQALTFGLWYRTLGPAGREDDPASPSYQRWAAEFPHMAEQMETLWVEFFAGIPDAKR